MRNRLLYRYCLLIALFFSTQLSAQQIEQRFLHPPVEAQPWVFWYWMHGAVSKAGITADLEAMKSVGIGGAYLMPIKDTSNNIPFQPTVRQLTPEWWGMVHFAMQEAKRLQLKLGMHVSDGFALAGGPWITPELSMQKLVWSKTEIRNGQANKILLPQPKSFQNYYNDVAVFAYPANYDLQTQIMQPIVTTSNHTDASFLADKQANQTFRSDTNCWIQYSYDTAVTIRSIQVRTGGNTYQALRLWLQRSDDGIHFTNVTRFDAPRHGWQDADEEVTFSIPSTTATHFRLLYDKAGTEPGAEDLDAAKWKPSLKVKGIYFSAEPVIHQYESKNGAVWRISQPTTAQQVPTASAVPLKKIIHLTGKLDADGVLHWSAPAGDWIIVRIGHTSTGHTNYTGGAGLGLECDKFNAAAVKLQFDSWFAKAFEQDEHLAKEVLKIFHVDSWECGSQNWSANFSKEFKKRRGYDLLPYLLTMTGVPVESAAKSEKVLHDVRQTIAELVNDVFYATLKKEAHAIGCEMSAEAIAPTMVSDGLMHYKYADIPMGEFWLNSPTHDKPNDMLDAISGAHIYGKNIIQSESFTSVRMNWNEHPGNLKIVGDRNFALGVNKMVMHVFTQNPWMDKKPGMTLDGVGLYYQRDQTWFKQSKAWIDYITRCQSLLQLGKPVVDIAVFTGEEIPRRSILPDRLVQTLPGIFGKEKVAAEKLRLENAGQPMRQLPDGVNHSANMADPEDWIDPLNGYSYDSFNPDVLMQMQVKNGSIILPGGASYKVLVIPGRHAMNPKAGMSTAVKDKLKQLSDAGANIILGKEWIELIGKKKNVMATPFTDSSFAKFGVQRDVEVVNVKNKIAWSHRKTDDEDIYFLSNQSGEDISIQVAFNEIGKQPEIFNPQSGKKFKATIGEIKNGKTYLWVMLSKNESVFVLFKMAGTKIRFNHSVIPCFGLSEEHKLKAGWSIQFDRNNGGPENVVKPDSLISWTNFPDSAIKFYSGTAVYSNSFEWNDSDLKRSISLHIGSLYNIATVKVNGIDCGIIWTFPYTVDIAKAMRQGRNTIEIEVTNTWHNRLIGDSMLPAEKRLTYTTAPFRLAGKPLQPAGLVGEVKLLIQ